MGNADDRILTQNSRKIEFRPPRNGNETWLKFGQLFVEKLNGSFN
jgi:hypothetical protein